jgi:hypothetical protein
MSLPGLSPGMRIDAEPQGKASPSLGRQGQPRPLIPGGRIRRPAHGRNLRCQLPRETTHQPTTPSRWSPCGRAEDSRTGACPGVGRRDLMRRSFQGGSS